MAQQTEPRPAEVEGKAAGEANTGSSTPDAMEKEAGLDNLVPYGTRSRNRGGNARPNYAEDKDYDVDMYDFDRTESKKTARQANAMSQGDIARGGPKKPAVADDAKAAASSSTSSSSSTSQNGASKDQTPSGSTGSLPATQPSASATQPSKKRKAAAAASSSSSSSQPTPNGNATALTRKFGNGTHSSSAKWPNTSNMLTFSDSKARLQNGHLVADDGTVLAQNDHVYLVCEPPGEPYYLGRIMEFLHPNNDTTKPIDALRINWYYRPRDIGRKVPDTRVVFATMHSDITPLTALRGKCQIRHRVDIGTPDAYRKNPDCFWFEKLYDRYIQKNYDLIPTPTIVNVPEKVKKVLDERWKFVLVEQGRGKELTSAVKSCKRCSAYCASNDSVDCAVCQNTYHMNCVKPPLLKKPSRGFAWSCAACSRAQERKLEARHTPNLADPYGDLDDDELLEEEEDDGLAIDTGRTSPDKDGETHHQGTPEQIYQASLWPWRYLGMHCKPEDALDYDDRIYPRASTRIGPRHQAPVNPWPGRPVQYIKPPEVKKGKKDAKAKAEAHAAQIAELYPDGKRPKWVQDTPPGYVARGEDPIDVDDPNATATLLWRPSDSLPDQETESFLAEAQTLATELGLPEKSTNLRDIALQSFFRKSGDAAAAFKAVKATDKKDFKEPLPTPAEQKKFEEGIGKYGSELHLVMKHVKTMTPGQIVRYYYTWKKTDRGQQVWGNYSGRKGKKEAKRAEAAATKLADDVADDEDDSAFDSNKAFEKKRSFMCQLCSTTTSRRWRRAPNATAGLVNENGVKATNKDKGTQFIVALCSRCAEIWRRYGIRWSELDEVAKKAGQMGGKGWKRKHEEELLKELAAFDEMGMLEPDVGLPAPNSSQPVAAGQEPPRKKVKSLPDKEAVDSDGGSASGAAPKKKEKEKEKEKEKIPEPPAMPEFPKPRTLPCAICDQVEPAEQHISCRECRLAVHRKCYGVPDTEKHPTKWTCQMCVNDKNPQVSIQYKCVLCPVEHTEHDFVDMPKLTHHKKKMTEKDRERERLEVQQARKAAEYYRKKQEELNRPMNPREPLKRTADNNWVHVTCAVWTPEVKFGNAKAMEPSEGIPSIPRSRYDEICTACGHDGGACIPCQLCRVPYHVECARRQGHVLGFEITPVKSSRRDQHNVVTLGAETGTMTASLWCKDHLPTKVTVHRIGEEVRGDGDNAGETLSYLQHFVQNFKQADLTLTGTVRKANLMTMVAKTSGALTQGPTRRASVTTPTSATVPNGTHQAYRNGETAETAPDEEQRSASAKVCITCGIDVSPRWWPIDNAQERELTNGHYGMIGSEAQKFVEQRKFQCHKCRKKNLTPVPHQSWPSSNAAPDAPRPPPPESGLQAPQPPAMRSPGSGYLDNRDVRPSYHGWPQQHHPMHSGPQPIHNPHHSQPHITAPRPGPLSQPYAAAHGLQSAPVGAPPPRNSFGSDWGNRPGSQHGTPPRHLNGGPPSLTNGPPLSNLSSLRPPSMAAPAPGAMPPSGPVGHSHSHSHGHGHSHSHSHGHGHGHGHGHSHGHGAPSYIKSLPPSPRRGSGAAPASPFGSTYQPAPAPVHAPPPPAHHAPPHHGVGNAPPPPRHERHERHEPFHDPFSNTMLATRPQQYQSHTSPPGSAQGLPPAHETRHPGPFPPRNGADGRPATGASASPSLRNLLS